MKKYDKNSLHMSEAFLNIFHVFILFSYDQMTHCRQGKNLSFQPKNKTYFPQFSVLIFPLDKLHCHFTQISFQRWCTTPSRWISGVWYQIFVNISVYHSKKDLIYKLLRPVNAISSRICQHEI